VIESDFDWNDGFRLRPFFLLQQIAFPCLLLFLKLPHIF
jgi:hypothetical protein